MTNPIQQAIEALERHTLEYGHSDDTKAAIASLRALQEVGFPPLLTDERIERIAKTIPLEGCDRQTMGWGIGYSKESDFLEPNVPRAALLFARAIESEVRTAIAAAGGGVPQGWIQAVQSSEAGIQLASMLRGDVNVGDFQKALRGCFEAMLASSPQPEAAQPNLVDDEGVMNTPLLRAARLLVSGSHPSKDCAGPYMVPADLWLTLQAEVMESLRQAAARDLANPVQPEAAPAVAQVPQAEPVPRLSGIDLAVIGRKHFGNPIPKEWYAACREALSCAAPEAPAVAQDVAIDAVLKERDDAEDFIDALLDEVLGTDRPEWSSAYGRADALEQVRERLAAPEAPAQGEHDWKAQAERTARGWMDRALKAEKQFAHARMWAIAAGVPVEKLAAAPEAPAQGDADSKRWRVRLICCGRDDGEVFFPTWEDADRFREQYTSGYAVEPQGYSAPEHASGHRRVGIVEDTWKAAPEAPAQAAPSAGEVERAAQELLRTLDHGAYPREDIDLDLVRLVCDAALNQRKDKP